MELDLDFIHQKDYNEYSTLDILYVLTLCYSYSW